MIPYHKYHVKSQELGDWLDKGPERKGIEKFISVGSRVNILSLTQKTKRCLER